MTGAFFSLIQALRCVLGQLRHPLVFSCVTRACNNPLSSFSKELRVFARLRWRLSSVARFRIVRLDLVLCVSLGLVSSSV